MLAAARTSTALVANLVGRFSRCQTGKLSGAVADETIEL
jgi:hypothetical protein